jgi:superfamily II DNA or RNA helicase
LSVFTLLKEFKRLEFHRHGLALLADRSEEMPGIAFLLRKTEDQPEIRYCSCLISKKRTCPHLLKLSESYNQLRRSLNGRTLHAHFQGSSWCRLARSMAGGDSETMNSVQVRLMSDGSQSFLQVLDSSGEEMVRYLSQGPDAERFMERFVSIEGPDVVPNRRALLDELANLTMNDSERYMLQLGFQTIGLKFEQSPWHRFGYHCFREWGDREPVLSPAIDSSTGAFTITCSGAGGEVLFRLAVRRERVKQVLRDLDSLIANQHGLKIHPIPLKSIFKATLNTELDLELHPVIQAIQENGESRFFAREDLERFRYGNLVYIKELEVLAELESPGRERKFLPPEKMVLKRSQIPHFLEEFGGDLRHGPYQVDPAVKGLKIFRRIDRVEISSEAIDRDWCWLSVRYGVGNTTLSLVEILRAKQSGRRYLSIADGWVDCESPDFADLEAISPHCDFAGGSQKNSLKLSRLGLFRLQAASARDLEIADQGREASETIKDILDLKPSRPLGELREIAFTLRPYQKLGVEWLRFLFENGLGGLLCDEMGLGKTHQVMALIAALVEQGEIGGPSLVVCPTTVLSHWRQKMGRFFPGAAVRVLHGSQRDLPDGQTGPEVWLTTYGILRNDLDMLRRVAFSLVAFDEIQHIKNAATQTYTAACGLNAAVKIGLTGTPIENRLSELKALFDLLVPGYLGSGEDFSTRYIQPIERNRSVKKREELSRLISPFVLRRTKEQVLFDLPEKIEDLRTCELSDDQVKLYRDALASRGRGLIEQLQREDEPIPYMHIFALLNLLKRICDHPALVDNRLENYPHLRSGKWDLFRELLAESLDSGEKVVVFSQYLGMIQIIKHYLTEQGIEFVTLTGSSRDRGEIVRRFNEDPGCRIFIGSLKAGGTGIDLIAGSIVIHYDRWWNAAREDQATDRVHRIGQRRCVQIFKLVTEGTLEEKISAIIDRKRHLMESVVRADDPAITKTLSRSDLLELLTPTRVEYA